MGASVSQAISRDDAFSPAALRGVGATCEIAFEDPDAVVVVETMNNPGSVAVWQRENLNRDPFPRPD
jgi:hypothetical protein